MQALPFAFLLSLQFRLAFGNRASSSLIKCAVGSRDNRIGLYLENGPARECKKHAILFPTPFQIFFSISSHSHLGATPVCNETCFGD